MNYRLRVKESLLSAIAAMICLVVLAGPLATPAKAKNVSSSKGRPDGMFALYDQNRKEGVPNYITEDFILLAHSMVLNKAITELEEGYLAPRFKELVSRLIDRLGKVEKPDQVAKANLAFLEVIQALLTGKSDSNQATVDKELDLVKAAQGIAMSPLMGQRLDYSQFKIRGKYTTTKELGRYFQAMKYAGAVLFPVLASEATKISKETADRLTAQALELSRLLVDDQEINQVYQDLDKTLTLLFGPSEELTSEDYLTEAAKTGSDIPTLRAALLETAQKENRRPWIISLVVDKGKLGKADIRDAVTGWRLIPQRYTPDSAAFQALVYDRIGEFNGKGKPFSLIEVNGQKVKGFPLGLELMSLLGSLEATGVLQKSGDAKYKGYDKTARSKAKTFLYQAKSRDLAAGNLRLMNYWLTRGQASQKSGLRRLNSCLGLWTYQRYMTLLYAKQSYTVGLKGMKLTKERLGAWLTPAPELYLYLRTQLARLNEIMSSRRLESMINVLDRCQTIASTELGGVSPDAEEVAFLNSLDKRLAALSGGKDQPIVVDVHTEPSTGQVLQEALGRPRIVTKKIAGKTEARGALFSYYEFKWPLKDRLTDEKWRALVKDAAKMKKLPLSPGSLVGEGR